MNANRPFLRLWFTFSIKMSLPGLPPLPKSLSGFDLAGGVQFQSSHHHHHLQQAQQQQHQHQQHSHHYPHHSLQHHQPQSVPAHQVVHQQHLGLSSHSSNHPPSSQSPVTLNHHHTNPFIPIGSSTLLHGSSIASLDSQQRGHSPVSAQLSAGSGGGGGGGARRSSPQPVANAAAPATTTLDTQLAILRREMVSRRRVSGYLSLYPVPNRSYRIRLTQRARLDENVKRLLIGFRCVAWSPWPPRSA